MTHEEMKRIEDAENEMLPGWKKDQVSEEKTHCQIASSQIS